MAIFHIEWRIEIEAETAEEAAQKAFAIQQKSDTTATVFHVFADNDSGDFVEIDVRQ